MATVQIDGVTLRALQAHDDSRGTLIEIYREAWDLGCQIVQTNLVTSRANVLRGVHVHVQHTDHLTLVAGSMRLGLHDLRPWTPTAGMSAQLDLDAQQPTAVVIPPGVAHGFYFPQTATLIYGTSHSWNPDDELACRWDAQEFGLSWPAGAPVLSERDAHAPGYPAFREKFLATWARVYGSLPSGDRR